jgi:hypothetical protein
MFTNFSDGMLTKDIERVVSYSDVTKVIDELKFAHNAWPSASSCVSWYSCPCLPCPCPIPCVMVVADCCTAFSEYRKLTLTKAALERANNELKERGFPNMKWTYYSGPQLQGFLKLCDGCDTPSLFEPQRMQREMAAEQAASDAPVVPPVLTKLEVELARSNAHHEKKRRKKQRTQERLVADQLAAERLVQDVPVLAPVESELARSNAHHEKKRRKKQRAQERLVADQLAAERLVQDVPVLAPVESVVTASTMPMPSGMTIREAVKALASEQVDATTTCDVELVESRPPAYTSEGADPTTTTTVAEVSEDEFEDMDASALKQLIAAAGHSHDGVYALQDLKVLALTCGALRII